MTDFIQARKNMVDTQVATNGVIDPAILEAFSVIPREIFAPKSMRSVCYSDQSFEIDKKRYMLAPMVFAKLVQAAAPQAHEVVLDVACANGYSSAIFSSLVSTVIAVDSVSALLSKAERNWKETDVNNVVSLCGDISSVSLESAPYDLIFINGAVAEIPAVLVSQLSEKGRLVTVLRANERFVGQAVIVHKSSGGGFTVKPIFEANLPYVTEFAPISVFAF